jgi:DNA-binding transcriptional ArsR family regulator
MGNERLSSQSKDVCELYCFNETLVNRLRQGLPEDEALERATALFSAMGSRTRLLILYCLSQAEELCVCDIANALAMNLSTISHQLRHLRQVGMVAFRSEGKMAFYRLTDERARTALAESLSAGSVTVET